MNKKKLMPLMELAKLILSEKDFKDETQKKKAVRKLYGKYHAKLKWASNHWGIPRKFDKNNNLVTSISDMEAIENQAEINKHTKRGRPPKR